MKNFKEQKVAFVVYYYKIAPWSRFYAYVTEHGRVLELTHLDHTKDITVEKNTVDSASGITDRIQSYEDLGWFTHQDSSSMYVEILSEEVKTFADDFDRDPDVSEVGTEYKWFMPDFKTRTFIERSVVYF